jgi:hypothetical protein
MGGRTMAGAWEIRGLFGNEYAMEQAIEELKKHEGFEWVVLDRRNLSVRFPKRDAENEELVKRTLEMYHGFAEHEGLLGEYDRMKQEERQKKLKKEEKKEKRR